jgi:hypothetical protein
MRFQPGGWSLMTGRVVLMRVLMRVLWPSELMRVL